MENLSEWFSSALHAHTLCHPGEAHHEVQGLAPDTVPDIPSSNHNLRLVAWSSTKLLIPFTHPKTLLVAPTTIAGLCQILSMIVSCDTASLSVWVCAHAIVVLTLCELHEIRTPYDIMCLVVGWRLPFGTALLKPLLHLSLYFSYIFPFTSPTPEQVDAVAMPPGPTNPHLNGFTAIETDLTTTAAAQRTTAPELGRIWKIKNPAVLNPITQQPVAYKLMPMAAPPLLASPESVVGKRAVFASKNLWVTPYDEEQKWPAGDYLMGSRECNGLRLWTQEVSDKDLQERALIRYPVLLFRCQQTGGDVAGSNPVVGCCCWLSFLRPQDLTIEPHLGRCCFCCCCRTRAWLVWTLWCGTGLE